jgi:hypothetical protein
MRTTPLLVSAASRVMARPDYFVLSHSMRRQTVITKKRRGPPATGKGTLLGVRLQPALLGRLDEWAESQEDKPSRPEAIRRLVEKALPPVTPKRTSPPGERTAKATKLAEEQVDRLIDPALPPEERERTKRRLIKGPKEFRDVRDRAKR